jgi:hypothetical protein
MLCICLCSILFNNQVYMGSNDMVISELERMWKESVMAYF